MRKFIAILFLSVYLFTSGGYRLVLNYFEQRADKSLAQKLDKHQYNEAELITIKVPLNLPYTIDRTEFERCDGTIKINGVYYNYVKRKLTNDTMFLQCIANHKKNELSAAKDEYAKITSSTQPSSASEKATSSLLKIFFFEYNCKTIYELSAYASALTYSFRQKNDNTFSSPLVMRSEKPPQLI